MSAYIYGDCIYVTKSVRIPISDIRHVCLDNRSGRTLIITGRGPTYCDDAYEEVAALLPGLADKIGE